MLALQPPHSANHHDARGIAFRGDHSRNKMNHIFRKVRIAFSVLCGIVCVLLIVLWVRSCNTSDTLFGRIDHYRVFSLRSSEGVISLLKAESEVGDWGIYSIVHPPGMEGRRGPSWRVATTGSPGWFVDAPYWFFVAAFALIGIAFWRPPLRFSLRTMLIATTLVAALLGAIVYASR
jgi:hypothetical protein